MGEAKAVVRHVPGRDDGCDAGLGPGSRGVQVEEARVRMAAPQQAGVEHSRADKIDAVLRPAGHLQNGIMAGKPLADDTSHGAPPLCRMV